MLAPPLWESQLALLWVSLPASTLTSSRHCRAEQHYLLQMFDDLYTLKRHSGADRADKNTNALDTSVAWDYSSVIKGAHSTPVRAACMEAVHE
jgi:hypothetical protein